MRTVLAAIDGGLATRPVLACAGAMARVLRAEVVAVHVRTDGIDTARAFAARAGVPLRVLRGPVIDRLVEAGSDPEVAATVIGARGLAAGPRTLGHTATAVATRLPGPVVVVPPHAEPPTAFRRVLVPLEGTVAATAAPRSLIELAPGSELDVVVLHVLGPDSIPPCVDQPQHWHAVWAREFIARYCPFGIDEVDLHTRVGRPELIVAQAAREYGCDAIVLGWSQNLTEGHARVVRATLRRSTQPVVLVPVRSDQPVTAPATLSSAVPAVTSQRRPAPVPGDVEPAGRGRPVRTAATTKSMARVTSSG